MAVAGIENPLQRTTGTPNLRRRRPMSPEEVAQRQSELAYRSRGEFGNATNRGMAVQELYDVQAQSDPDPLVRMDTELANEGFRRLGLIRSPQRVFDPANPGATPQQVNAMGGRYAPVNVSPEVRAMARPSGASVSQPFARTGATTGAVYNPTGERMDPQAAQRILESQENAMDIAGGGREGGGVVRADPAAVQRHRERNRQGQQREAQQREQIRQYQQERQNGESFDEWQQRRTEESQQRAQQQARTQARQQQADLERRQAESEIDLNRARAEDARREPAEGQQRDFQAEARLDAALQLVNSEFYNPDSPQGKWALGVLMNNGQVEQQAEPEEAPEESPEARAEPKEPSGAQDQFRRAGRIVEPQTEEPRTEPREQTTAESAGAFVSDLERIGQELMRGPVGRELRKGTANPLQLIQAGVEAAAEPYVEQFQRGRAGLSGIPEQAIQALVQNQDNPQIRSDFDAKYGQGRAQSILDSLPEFSRAAGRAAQSARERR